MEGEGQWAAAGRGAQRSALPSEGAGHIHLQLLPGASRPGHLEHSLGRTCRLPGPVLCGTHLTTGQLRTGVGSASPSHMQSSSEASPGLCPPLCLAWESWVGAQGQLGGQEARSASFRCLRIRHFPLCPGSQVGSGGSGGAHLSVEAPWELSPGLQLLQLCGLLPPFSWDVRRAQTLT